MPDPPPVFTFTAHPSVAAFDVPAATYLASAPPLGGVHIQHLATGALVFHHDHTSGKDRVLVVRRAAHDSLPGRWEVPGGACDDDDPSVLYAVARELWEEAGLVATHVGPVVANDVFLTGAGRVVLKLTFSVDVGSNPPGESTGTGTGTGTGAPPTVTLDPDEHQAHLWVTEEEATAGQAGDVEITFTCPEQRAVILKGFRVRKEREVDDTAAENVSVDGPDEEERRK